MSRSIIVYAAIAALWVVIIPLGAFLAWYEFDKLAYDSAWLRFVSYVTVPEGPFSLRVLEITIFNITNLLAVVLSLISSNAVVKGGVSRLVWFAFAVSLVILGVSAGLTQSVLNCGSSQSDVALTVDQVFGVDTRAAANICVNAHLSLWPPIGAAVSFFALLFTEQGGA